jgi:prolipoprotein diacylglyceryltransferase
VATELVSSNAQLHRVSYIQLVPFATSTTVGATVPHALRHKALCICFFQHLVELTGICMFLYWTIQSHSAKHHVCFISAVFLAHSAALRFWVHITAQKLLHLSRFFSQICILLVSQVSSPLILFYYHTDIHALIIVQSLQFTP